MDTLDTFRVSRDAVPSWRCSLADHEADTVHVGVDPTSRGNVRGNIKKHYQSCLNREIRTNFEGVIRGFNRCA